MRRKKVLFVLSSVRVGGAEKYLTKLAALLQQKNIILDLLVLTEIKSHTTTIETKDFGQVFFLNSSRNTFSIIKIIRILNKNYYSTVLSTMTVVNIILLIAKCFSRYKPRILVRETNVLSEIGNSTYERRLYTYAIRRLYKYADGVIAQSKFMAHELERLGISGKSIYVINNHCEHKNIDTTNRVNDFIQVGSLTQIKNNQLALRALANMKNTTANLTILGEGPELSNLICLAKDLDILNRVSFIGHKKDVDNYFKSHKIYLQTSVYDSFPNSVLEALSHGLAVVALDSKGGVKEMLQETSGIIVSNSVKEFSLAMDNLIDSKIDYIKTAELANTRFNESQIVDRYYSLL